MGKVVINDFKEYMVIVGFETGDDGQEYPVAESQVLQESDVRENYEWADVEETILKLKKQVL